MIQTHRLTIIPSDKAVYCDAATYLDLDLSQCGIPKNIHALQWNHPLWPEPDNSHLAGLEYGQGTGWIEFRSHAHNEHITELPEWAINCYYVWLEKHNQELQNNQPE
jgi:hypothetical protein